MYIIYFAIWGTSLGQNSKCEVLVNVKLTTALEVGQVAVGGEKGQSLRTSFMSVSLPPSPIIHIQSSGRFSWLCLQNLARV